MEVKSKQEDYHPKLARDMHNFHHGGGDGVKAYEDMLVTETSLLKDIMELVTSLLILNLTGIILMMNMGVYDRDNAKYDYYEHSPYDFYEGYHHTLHVIDLSKKLITSCSPCCFHDHWTYLSCS
ncbi:hypothetical protein M9H77_04243 [Catharanthus roseus]|uniref:Uncharacterized protein n=1 Tax=Catharanthus roseus TaxID=4058 RepID=A0ACC0CDL0_CATRO|nr:hypothetical protein M9H77_04243 [Catharanthus roseus]